MDTYLEASHAETSVERKAQIKQLLLFSVVRRLPDREAVSIPTLLQETTRKVGKKGRDGASRVRPCRGWTKARRRFWLRPDRAGWDAAVPVQL